LGSGFRCPFPETVENDVWDGFFLC